MQCWLLCQNLQLRHSSGHKTPLLMSWPALDPDIMLLEHFNNYTGCQYNIVSLSNCICSCTSYTLNKHHPTSLIKSPRQQICSLVLVWVISYSCLWPFQSPINKNHAEFHGEKWKFCSGGKWQIQWLGTVFAYWKRMPYLDHQHQQSAGWKLDQSLTLKTDKSTCFVAVTSNAHQEVVWLQVTMNETLAVHVFYTTNHLQLTNTY